MTIDRSRLQGIWLPLITPFRDDTLDEASLSRLLQHYFSTRIDGLIFCATTGEGHALTPSETQRIVELAAKERAESGRDIPIVLGISGSWTRGVHEQLHRATAWPIDGYLISSPSYVRPSQAGLYEHFSSLADRAGHPLIIYNIPYRTGINIANDTLLQLATHDNIVGVKDCCGDAAQSFDLIRFRPDNFAVLTGEDPQFYSAQMLGADGGIHASAHVLTNVFSSIRDLASAGDTSTALAQWQRLADVPQLLFSAPSPAPLKHWLWRAGLIASPEVRLPLVGIDEGLAARIDAEIKCWTK